MERKKERTLLLAEDMETYTENFRNLGGQYELTNLFKKCMGPKTKIHISIVLHYISYKNQTYNNISMKFSFLRFIKKYSVPKKIK